MLRKALLVATKLDLVDAVQWIEKELSGWANEDWDATPAWRKVTGQVVAKNPFRGWQPVIIENSDFARTASLRPVPMPASEIEALIEHEHKDGGTLISLYSPEVEKILRDSLISAIFRLHAK